MMAKIRATPCAPIHAVSCVLAIAVSALLLSQRVPAQAPVHLDPGGVSIDFSQAGQSLQTVGDNLIRNGGFEDVDPATGKALGWRDAFHVYTGDEAERTSVTEKLSPEATRFLSNDRPHSGMRCAVVSMPAEAYKKHSKAKPDFSNYFNHYCALPELTEDTKYMVRFRYRGHVEKGTPQGRIRLSIGFLDQVDMPWRGKRTRDHVQQFYAEPTREWKTGSMQFVAPKETRSLRIDLLLHGYGNVAFDDLELYEVPIESGVTMLLMPFGMLDNLFTVSSGDVGLLRFSFRNETGRELEQVHALLELPADIPLVDVRLDQQLLEEMPIPGTAPAMMRYRIDYSGLKHTISKEGYAAYHSLSCMVTTKLPAGDQAFQGRYWVEDDQGASVPRTFRIQVVPPIRGKRPKQFKTAVMFTRDALYDRDDAIQALADFYDGCGFTSAHLPEGKLSLAVAERGIDRYVQPYWMCNGYRIGSQKKPDSAKFQFVDGTYHVNGICPVEVYKRGEYFQTQVVDDLLRKLIVTTRQTDHVMPNWEPYMFDFKGCFCTRCRDEFQKYTQLSEQDVAAIWPDSVIMKHRDAWIKFRSWQHAQMMTTFEAVVNDLGKEAGIESHFIPEVAWTGLIPGWDTLHPGHRNYSVLDYAAKLPWLEPWGPYNWFKMEYPYEYRTGCHLSILGAALVTEDFLAATIKDAAKRPKLIAFPHGYQGDTWVTEPESVAFETLAFFVGGWDGSFAYIFPRGYDARYWRELAHANTLIATHEDLVMNGTRSDQHSFELVTPIPSSQESSTLSHLDWQEQPIVQCLAFERDGKRLYATVNAWERGECFANLKITGLDRSMRYVLHEPSEGRCYAAGSKETALTAAALENGILLHTGALRISFFVVEPFDENTNYGTIVSEVAMREMLTSRTGDINAAMVFEAKHAALFTAQEAGSAALPNYPNIKSMTLGVLNCKAVVPDRIGSPCIEFTSPLQRVLVDPAQGGRVASWRVGEFEVAHQDEKLGLGVDAIWWPPKSASFLDAPQRVVEQRALDDGLIVVLECVLGKEAKGLKGLTLRKTVSVPSDGTGFTLTTELLNTTEAEHEFSFRYHNMTSYLEFVDGQKGRAVMNGQSGESVFERRLMKEMYCHSTATDDRLEKAFSMEKRKLISSPVVEFSCPWSPVRVKVTPDVEKLHAIIYWDSGQQKCATFEPVFSVATLQPGETWRVSVRWETF